MVQVLTVKLEASLYHPSQVLDKRKCGIVLAPLEVAVDDAEIDVLIHDFWVVRDLRRRGLEEESARNREEFEFVDNVFAELLGLIPGSGLARLSFFLAVPRVYLGLVASLLGLLNHFLGFVREGVGLAGEMFGVCLDFE